MNLEETKESVKVFTLSVLTSPLALTEGPTPTNKASPANPEDGISSLLKRRHVISCVSQSMYLVFGLKCHTSLF